MMLSTNPATTAPMESPALSSPIALGEQRDGRRRQQRQEQNYPGQKSGFIG